MYCENLISWPMIDSSELDDGLDVDDDDSYFSWRCLHRLIGVTGRSSSSEEEIVVVLV